MDYADRVRFSDVRRTVADVDPVRRYKGVRQVVRGWVMIDLPADISHEEIDGLFTEEEAARRAAFLGPLLQQQAQAAGLPAVERVTVGAFQHYCTERGGWLKTMFWAYAPVAQSYNPYREPTYGYR